MIALLLSLSLLLPADEIDPVDTALTLAGGNRAEIERFLANYPRDADPEKHAAARFLVENMPGHGFVDYALVDSEGNEVPFDAIEHGGLGAAQAALRALESEHGSLNFKGVRFTEDLEVLTADALIANHELAFARWRTSPWTRKLSFEAFCEYILPHRGSNEPHEDWRTAFHEILDDGLDGLPDGAAIGDVASLARAASRGRIGFSDLYYLHPTDQGFSQMVEARRGRCEDITNMDTYAYRAAGVASAADYTPYWGHRDNNHAWPVILRADGTGSAGDGNRAAKVYRKTYSKQLDNLVYQLADGEKGPPWLNRGTYQDVTDQYFETSDITIQMNADVIDRFAYLCVFNGGDWKPIHWGRIEAGRVTFDRMGRNLLYLPATFKDGEVTPAAPPFFLTADGSIQPCDPSPHFSVSAHLWTTGGGKPELNAEGVPVSRLREGTTYELFVWRGEWQSIANFEAEADTRLQADLPIGGLFWLLPEGSRRLERPFVVEDAELRFR